MLTRIERVLNKVAKEIREFNTLMEIDSLLCCAVRFVPIDGQVAEPTNRRDFPPHGRNLGRNRRSRGIYMIFFVSEKAAWAVQLLLLLPTLSVRIKIRSSM